LTGAIDRGWSDALAAGFIRILNSAGALCVVYARRFGKATIVAPITAMAPVLTMVVSLLLY
jgi:uncharacterized membrane protein